MLALERLAADPISARALTNALEINDRSALRLFLHRLEHDSTSTASTGSPPAAAHAAAEDA